MNYQTQDRILKDVSKTGKDRKWRERKINTLNLAQAFHDCCIDELVELGYSREDAVSLAGTFDEISFNRWLKKRDKTWSCGEHLEFIRTSENRLKLYKAYFCKDRLCPLCNWRRATKFTVQIAEILNVMKERKITGRPIFLTLTMKNVKGNEIGDSFSHFAESFHRLMKYKVVKDNCIGAIRTSEVTYNRKADTYNTHIHCLLWMKSKYYKDSSRYLSQAKWTELWQRAARLDYTPIVNVKAIKPATPTEADPTGLFKAVLEVAKYPVKPDAFNNVSAKSWGEDSTATSKHIQYLENGMFKKRLISFFGIFKDIRAELQLDDIEDGDLINADEDNAEEEQAEAIERYSFNYVKQEYYLQD